MPFEHSYSISESASKRYEEVHYLKRSLQIYIYTRRPTTKMKTVRLLYPDHVSGGLETYYFVAKLLSHILPENPNQPLVEVKIDAPDGKAPAVTDGIAGLEKVVAGIRSAKAVIAREAPERIVTIGGNCIVSLAAFDYLHGLHPNTGIVWIDSHPDVSLPENGYPNAHAMVLGALLGSGADALRGEMANPPFGAKDLLYVGLQGLLDYQRSFLEAAGVDFMLQNETFVPDEKIGDFVRRYDRILVHLDIDVLDPKCFHSTYKVLAREPANSFVGVNRLFA